MRAAPAPATGCTLDETTRPVLFPAADARWSPAAVARAAMWASLVPLTLLLRPYGGLAQDARIYIGRGVADHDLAGVGRDTVFAHDGQNGFSVMARVVDALLGVVTPDAAAMLIAMAGLAAWLVASVALALQIARGRTAWAIVVGLLALPGIYGGFGTFGYGEAVATPRTFAEAAVLGGFAALLAGRSRFGLASMLVAAAFHPLMAVPGIAVAAVMLVHADRRWLIPVAAATAAVLGGALLGAPFLGRLATPFDPAWAAILRQRSVNLFPSLWSSAVYILIARRLAAALIAASLLTGPPRVLFLAASGVALAGLGVAALLGDAWTMELVTQLQPWRSLWLLSVMGNAGFVVSAVRLWRGGGLDRLTLAALAAAWLADQMPVLEIAGLAAALGLRAASRRGYAPPVPRRALEGAAVLVACLAAYDVAQSGMASALLLGAAWAQGGEATWGLAIDADLPMIPVMGAALALACAPAARLHGIGAAWPRGARGMPVAAVVAASVLGLLAWNETSAERGAPTDTAALAALRRAIGPAPGDVMWIDEDSENWFLAGRPAFFDTVQGAPILFSRALALDWADRAAFARRLGWAREIDISPWTAPQRRLDPILLRPEAVSRFCASPWRPAAVVAPGDQRDAAAPGWTSVLWRPAVPFHRMWVDDGTIRWTTWDVFTVIRCPPPHLEGDARHGDARSLG